MKTHTAYEGCKPSGHSEHQQRSITCTIISILTSFLKSVLGATLPMLAVLTCSCMKESHQDMAENTETMRLELKSPEGRTVRPTGDVEIFSFDADSLGRLNSYQKITGITDGNLSVCTTGGRKRIFVCCNSGMTSDEVMRIGSIEDLRTSFCMLEGVNREALPMCGNTETDTGSGHCTTINLTPMTSEIVLRSVCCRFTGTSYEGESITDARAYLTNVNAQCSLTDTSLFAQRYINIGMLNMNDVERFTEQDIIIQDIGQDIEENRIQTDISFICFHNRCEDETPGSPFTRLVIEGKIRGETYYWPLTVNRAVDGHGIGNNTRHVFDLTIRRKGSKDPDMDVFIEDKETIMEVLQWEEKEDYSVRF